MLSDILYVAVGGAGDIAPGHSAVFTINDRSIVIFNHDGELFAVENRCPHQGAPLAGAPILKGGRVRCLVHGWLFRLRGCEEDDEIRRYPLRVDKGQIWVGVEPFPDTHVVDGVRVA